MLEALQAHRNRFRMMHRAEADAAAGIVDGRLYLSSAVYQETLDRILHDSGRYTRPLGPGEWQILPFLLSEVA